MWQVVENHQHFSYGSRWAGPEVISPWISFSFFRAHKVAISEVTSQTICIMWNGQLNPILTANHTTPWALVYIGFLRWGRWRLSIFRSSLRNVNLLSAEITVEIIKCTVGHFNPTLTLSLRLLSFPSFTLSHSSHVKLIHQGDEMPSNMASDICFLSNCLPVN